MSEAEKGIIRVATVEDAAQLLEIYRPYVEQTAITFEYEVPSVEEFRHRIETVLARYPYLVYEQDGKIFGYAYVGPFHERAAYDWAVETSIYVRMDDRKQGIGHLLYEKLEEILKKQGILNLNACIAYPKREDAHLTTGSIAFHERMGYQVAGHFHSCGYKFDTWYDMVWMEKHIGEHEKGQRPVLPFPELRKEQ